MWKSITLWLASAIALITSFGLITPAFAADITTTAGTPVRIGEIAHEVRLGVIEGVINFGFPVCDGRMVNDTITLCQSPQYPIAHISAVNLFTHTTVSTTSDNNGRYTLWLPTGWYAVTVSATGPCIDPVCNGMNQSSTYHIFMIAPFHFHHFTYFHY